MSLQWDTVAQKPSMAVGLCWTMLDYVMEKRGVTFPHRTIWVGVLHPVRRSRPA